MSITRSENFRKVISRANISRFFKDRLACLSRSQLRISIQCSLLFFVLILLATLLFIIIVITTFFLLFLPSNNGTTEYLLTFCTSNPSSFGFSHFCLMIFIQFVNISISNQTTYIRLVGKKC